MEKAVKCTQNVLPDFVQVYSMKRQNLRMNEIKKIHEKFRIKI